MPNVTKNAPVSRHFCSQGPRKRDALFSGSILPAEFLWLQGGFAGWLAQVCPHALDLGGIFRHGLLGGLEHVVTVVRHGLADGTGLGLLAIMWLT